jgi:hypothetical protein
MVMRFYECLMVMTVVDMITGIMAAVHRKEKVCPSTFINKFGRKFVKQFAYLGIAWTLSHMLKDFTAVKGQVTEPTVAALGAFIAADIVSSLRNLSAAKNNYPVLDRMFRKLARVFTDFDADPEPKLREKKTP